MRLIFLAPLLLGLTSSMIGSLYQGLVEVWEVGQRVWQRRSRPVNVRRCDMPDMGLA